MDSANWGNSTIVLEDPFSRRSIEEWGNLNGEILVPPTPPMNPLSTAPLRIFIPRNERIYIIKH